MDADLNALWRTIYGEAEPDDELDALAIGHVILNRVRWKNWPSTVRGVCYQPWQFSCWNPGAARLDHLNQVAPEHSDWAGHCHRLARRLMEGEAGPDPTHGATHYYATWAKPPTWAKGKTPTLETRAGRFSHRFYNDIDTPAPEGAAEALEQLRPLSRTRTLRGGRLAAGAGSAALISGAVAEIGTALPVLTDLAAAIREQGPLMLLLLGAVAVTSVGYMLYARSDDRRQGLR